MHFTNAVNDPMSPLPPRLIAKPSIETVAEYFREGKKRLKKAISTYPELPPWDALIEFHRDSESQKIRGSSARKYFEEDSRALLLVLRFHRMCMNADALVSDLKSKIDERRGRPARYGAGNKARNVTEAEAIAVFHELKRHALETLYWTDVIASLFVLVASHSGFRPREMVGARLEGTILFVRNAKRKPGQDEERGFDLSGLPSDVLIAVELLIRLVPEFPSRLAYKAWAKDVAEALARACKRAGIRRLSLYSFRHLALATWKKAGLTGQDIALLAGHISENSARHYAGARHGLDRNAIIKPARTEPMDHGVTKDLEDSQASVEASGIDAVAAAPLFLLDDPPEPIYRPVLTPDPLPHDLVFEHFDRIARAAEPRKPLPEHIYRSSYRPASNGLPRRKS